MTFSPNLGRWLQQDPIGYADGTMNSYELEGDNAVNQTDAIGLEITAKPRDDRHYVLDLANSPIANWMESTVADSQGKIGFRIRYIDTEESSSTPLSQFATAAAKLCACSVAIYIGHGPAVPDLPNTLAGIVSELLQHTAHLARGVYLPSLTRLFQIALPNTEFPTPGTLMKVIKTLGSTAGNIAPDVKVRFYGCLMGFYNSAVSLERTLLTVPGPFRSITGEELDNMIQNDLKAIKAALESMLANKCKEGVCVTVYIGADFRRDPKLGKQFAAFTGRAAKRVAGKACGE